MRVRVSVRVCSGYITTFIMSHTLILRGRVLRATVVPSVVMGGRFSVNLHVAPLVRSGGSAGGSGGGSGVT